MNPVEIGLSFLEGLALIVSPCILPVLPLVLSASVEGGRKRPFGIILGFVIAFTLFALLSRKLVMAFHIDLDHIKYGSLILLALFGLVLLSESLSEKFSALTQRFASAGSTLTANAKAGFGSGILIGMLIGLVWTPCAGPILAAVLVQVIRQQNDLQALFLIAAFAFGAGVPMLIISLVGRKVMNRLGFFTRHAEAVRKSFGVIILLTVVFIASGADVQSLVTKGDTAIANPDAGLVHALAKPYPAPEFAGIESWLNSAPLTMKGLKGKVVLVDFWTYSCINCVRTLPYITAWDAKYRDKGLVIIGVSAPEFEFEKNVENVKAAVTDGKLGGQATVPGVAGTWKDLTDSVNSMASNLTGQVRNIAEVSTAIASGNLSKKITVNVSGEILLLKETINTMVDQLNAFAGEVTRVAREVGPQCRYGGQANVPGVAGTWKDLTDNVNLMASNLTGQVRNIAEVTTAVARGDPVPQDHGRRKR